MRGNARNDIRNRGERLSMQLYRRLFSHTYEDRLKDESYFMNSEKTSENQRPSFMLEFFKERIHLEN